MKKRILLISLGLWAFLQTATAQNLPVCVSEIITCEAAEASIGETTQALLIRYQVKVKNQDDEITESNVKLYSHGGLMNFFSEQAVIYRNDAEVLMILPQQKVLVLSSTTPQMNQYKAGDGLMNQHKAVLEHCEVVSCEEIGNQRKRTVLKVNPLKSPAVLSISRLTYEYDPVSKTILSVKTEYSEDYKLKEMTVTYRTREPAEHYRFPDLKRLYSDKRGKLLEKYKGYEVMDNRETRNNRKKQTR
jgi:hypothetical protein